MARAKSKETLKREAKIVKTEKITAPFRRLVQKYGKALLKSNEAKSKLSGTPAYIAYTQALEELKKAEEKIHAIGLQIKPDETIEESVKVGDGKLGIQAVSRTINQKKLLKIIGQKKFNEIAVIPMNVLDDVLDAKQKKNVVKSVNDGKRRFSFKFAKK